MATHNITLTATEEKAMTYVALNVSDWIDNAAKNRARIAIEEIIQKNTEYCNENNIQIAVGIDGQVQQAFDNGVVITAVQNNATMPAPTPSGPPGN